MMTGNYKSYYQSDVCLPLVMPHIQPDVLFRRRHTRVIEVAEGEVLFEVNSFQGMSFFLLDWQPNAHHSCFCGP